jgi:hypothetical protein
MAKEQQKVPAPAPGEPGYVIPKIAGYREPKNKPVAAAKEVLGTYSIVSKKSPLNVQIGFNGRQMSLKTFLELACKLEPLKK